VIAHELSHLMLGHLETASETVGVIDEAFADTEATIFSHEAEFEADAAGAVLATETAVRLGYSNALTSVAPYIFLKGIQVLDACQALHDRPTGGIDSTHPSSEDRLNSMRAVMARHMVGKDPDENLPTVLKRIDQVFY
jgi:predicted Zn-dependent protease